MQAFVTNKPASRRTSRRLLLPAAAVLLIGGTAFVAAGGLTLIRSWFATVTVNGNVVHTGEIVLDEHGQATLTVPEGTMKPDGENQVTVELTAPADATPGVHQFTITGSDQQLTVQETTPPDPNDPNSGQ